MSQISNYDISIRDFMMQLPSMADQENMSSYSERVQSHLLSILLGGDKNDDDDDGCVSSASASSISLLQEKLNITVDVILHLFCCFNFTAFPTFDELESDFIKPLVCRFCRGDWHDFYSQSREFYNPFFDQRVNFFPSSTSPHPANSTTTSKQEQEAETKNGPKNCTLEKEKEKEKAKQQEIDDNKSGVLTKEKISQQEEHADGRKEKNGDNGKGLQRWQRKVLTSDGEVCCPVCVCPGFLILGLALMTCQNNNRKNKSEMTEMKKSTNDDDLLFPSFSTRKLRCFFRHQLILLHPSHSLYMQLAACVKASLKRIEGEHKELLALEQANMKENGSETPKNLLLLQNKKYFLADQLLEIGHVQAYYHRADESAETFRQAVQITGLQLKETFMLGVRIRWAKEPMAQTMLVATSAATLQNDAPEEKSGENMNKNTKKNIFEEVDHSHRLPLVLQSFADGHDFYDRPVARNPKDLDVKGLEQLREPPQPTCPEEEVTPLHPTDYAIILALCSNLKHLNPHFRLSQTQIQTYIERLIVDPTISGHQPQKEGRGIPWILRCVTLLTRSRLERGRNRVQERAFLQFQELVDQFADVQRTDKIPSTFYRCDARYFYTVNWPSFWKIKTEFGSACMDDNLFKTALAYFEQVQDWEQVIQCCDQLGRRKKAENIILDLLKDDPENAHLHVALGTATREESHFWKAWELCQHTMASPMRGLAKLALDREQYEKVVAYFDESVKLNPIFGGDWFSLGYASLKLKTISRAGEAFTRVCQMDPSNAWSWNNLASILLEQGKTRSAFNAISQSLRNNRREWQLWDNYFQIGVELGEVQECTHALKIVLDIAGRKYKVDNVVFLKFVDVVLDYLKQGAEDGKEGIHHAKEEKEEKEEEKTVPKGKPENEGVEATMKIPHTKVGELAAAQEGLVEELQETTDLQPLTWDWTSPEERQLILKREQEEAQVALETRKRKEEADRAIYERYLVRIRELLLSLINMFVMNEELFAGCAILFGYLDGPVTEFDYRLRELRASQNKPTPWQREEKLFERVAKSMLCISSLMDAQMKKEDGGAASFLNGEQIRGESAPVKPPTNINTKTLKSSSQGPPSETHREDKKKSSSDNNTPLLYLSKENLQTCVYSLEAILNTAKDSMGSHPQYFKMKKVLARQKEYLAQVEKL